MTNILQSLESKMVTYTSLLKVSVQENDERFTIVEKDMIPNEYSPEMNDMRSYFGGKILVRESVYAKLLHAQKKLQKYNTNYSLFLTYGYRTLEIQTTRFLNRIRNETIPFFQNPNDLYEEIHRSIAVPTVAGHPTGGAIDITIIDRKKNETLQFGSTQYDYTNKKYYVFHPNVTREAKTNRMLLRSVLIEQGFAPFDGEWWHFSYGDREWAYYYKQPSAIYDQKNLKQITLQRGAK